MAIFLDTGFFMGLCHPLDDYREPALSIMNRMSSGEFGIIYSSPYIVAETTTLITARTNNNEEIIAEFFSYLYGTSCFVELLPCSADLDNRTWPLFRKMNQKGKTRKEWLSWIDASSIIFCQDHQIQNIASFDPHFQGFLTVISK